MKKLILVACIFAFASAVTAQKTMPYGKTTFSIAGNVGGVTSALGKLAAGGDLQADIPVASGLKITLSGGYENFGYETNSGVKFHSSYIPILAGAKFNLSTNLYGHGQLGYSVSTHSGGTGAFTYAPSLGYMVSKNFDISAKYFGLSRNGGTTGAIVARLAYNF